MIDFQVDSATSIAAMQANRFNRTPRIMPFIDGNRLTVVMESVREGDELAIAEALLDALKGNA